MNKIIYLCIFLVSIQAYGQSFTERCLESQNTYRDGVLKACKGIKNQISLDCVNYQGSNVPARNVRMCSLIKTQINLNCVILLSDELDLYKIQACVGSTELSNACVMLQSKLHRSASISNCKSIDNEISLECVRSQGSWVKPGEIQSCGAIDTEAELNCVQSLGAMANLYDILDCSDRRL